MKKEERRLERLRNKLTPFFVLVSLLNQHQQGNVPSDKVQKLLPGVLAQCNLEEIKKLLDDHTTLEEMEAI